jgi:hypothetical protein
MMIGMSAGLLEVEHYVRNDRASMHYGKVFSKGHQFDQDWQNYRYFLYIALFLTGQK